MLKRLSYELENYIISIAQLIENVFIRPGVANNMILHNFMHLNPHIIDMLDLVNITNLKELVIIH